MIQNSLVYYCWTCVFVRESICPPDLSKNCKCVTAETEPAVQNGHCKRLITGECHGNTPYYSIGKPTEIHAVLNIYDGRDCSA